MFEVQEIFATLGGKTAIQDEPLRFYTETIETTGTNRSAFEIEHLFPPSPRAIFDKFDLYDFDNEEVNDDFDDDFDDDFEELPDDEFEDFGEEEDEVDEMEILDDFVEEIDEPLDGDGFDDFDDFEADENTFDDDEENATPP